MKRIIIVEDDPSIQDAARMVLERAGYAVTIYINGDPILHGVAAIPDLYIIDKQLSGVDGLDICRHLKTQRQTTAIPVIMISASPHISAQAKSAGAEEFLEKPFAMKTLREAVARLLNNQ